MASSAHVKAIKSLQRRAGIDDGDYRALLAKETGQQSSRDLTDAAAVGFIQVLRGFAGDGGTPARADRATGKYAPVLQALWLSAWHLGLVRAPNDRAMLAFVARQTGVSHTRFLQDAGDAAKAIEGLKAWIARDGGVEWPAGRDDALGRKEAVARAIARRLHQAGGFTPFVPGTDPWPSDYQSYGYARGLPASFRDYGAAEWDRFIGYLGPRLRATLAKGKPSGGAHG